MGWLISIPPKTMVCWNSNPQDLKMWFYLEKQSLYPSWIMGLSWQRGLHNSMKLWAKSCRATQDRWAIVKSSNKTWFTGGGNGKSLKSSCHENHMKSMKKQQKDMTPEDDPPGQKVSNMLLGKSGGQLLIVPEGMKRQGHSGHDVQLWVCLMVKVKSNTIKNNIGKKKKKNNIAQEPGRLGSWTKVTWTQSNRRW